MKKKKKISFSVKRESPKMRKPSGFGTKVHKKKDRALLERQHNNEIKEAYDKYN